MENVNAFDRSPGRFVGDDARRRDASERAAPDARMINTQKLASLGLLGMGIVHDFQNALTVIHANAAAIRSDASLPARCLDHLELIDAACVRAIELARNLLDYTRNGLPEPEPTDLNVVIQDAQAFIRSSIGPGHEMSLMLAENLPPIGADPNQLKQVLLNLCLNAAQAMPSGGPIAVETRSSELTAAVAAKCLPKGAKGGACVELVVRDEGSGMDRGTLDRIFDPHFSTKGLGRGLGLSALLAILRQHHAVAWVDTEVGRGTSFHMCFPTLPKSNK